MAVVVSLSLTSEISIKQAILKGDSLVVIKSLRENVKALSPTGLLLEDVTTLSQNFDELLYSHTKRDGNQAVHSLARSVIGIPNFLV